MKALLKNIKECQICVKYLPFGPNPIVSAHSKSKIIIIGQAPGKKVHDSGVAWNDPSGKQLRSWLGVTDEQFYNSKLFALMPMGFCYPGKGASGDLPPRPECQPAWHNKLLKEMPDIKLTLLIGQYAQNHYLGENGKKTLTENVMNYDTYLKRGIMPLPHPWPRNRFWQAKNPWFLKSGIPDLQQAVTKVLQ